MACDDRDKTYLKSGEEEAKKYLKFEDAVRATCQCRGFIKFNMLGFMRNPSSVNAACNCLRGDKKVMGPLLKIDGTVLRFGTSKIRESKKMVYIATKQNHEALSYADPKARNDTSLCRRLLHECPLSVPFFGDEVFADPVFAVEIIVKCPEAFYRLECGLRRSRIMITLLLSVKGSEISSLEEKDKEDKDYVEIAMLDDCSSSYFIENEQLFKYYVKKKEYRGVETE